MVGQALFVMVKYFERAIKKKEEEAPSAQPKQEVLLEEIRDLLQK